MKICDICGYSNTNYSNFSRHVKAKHPNRVESKKQQNLLSENFTNNQAEVGATVSGEVYDIRLKENFKLFVSGPSRCGKTVFVSKLLENIQAFSKQAPSLIIYVYKVWQDKYDEMGMMGINFIQDNENIVDWIKSYAGGQPILVIFDDLIGSKFLPQFANMFTVDARHINISMVFLSQRMFVIDEYFRQI